MGKKGPGTRVLPSSMAGTVTPVRGHNLNPTSPMRSPTVVPVGGHFPVLRTPVVSHSAPHGHTYRTFEKWSVASDVHVLIANVPWRRSSLNALLSDVHNQTIRPAYVHLVLDGDDVPNTSLDLSSLDWDGLQVTIKVNHPGRGAGARWDVALGLPESHYIMNLDDDVRLSSDYIARHREALNKSDAVCSGGYPSGSNELIMCTQSHAYEGDISCLQAGAFSARASVLRGLRDMPMADEMLGLRGDDEGLIAAHLWRKGIAVKRVNVPVRFDPSAGDPRAQSFEMGSRILPLRRRLAAATGWPWRL